MLYIAKHFGDKQGEEVVVVHHRFTQADIATLVGIARETVSIELMKLEKKGLVEYIDHSMRFDNIQNLEAELYVDRARP